MDLNPATKLRREWGTQPCDHPQLESDYLAGSFIEGESIAGGFTGDLYCSYCGAIFTPAQAAELEERRAAAARSAEELPEKKG